MELRGAGAGRAAPGRRATPAGRGGRRRARSARRQAQGPNPNGERARREGPRRRACPYPELRCRTEPRAPRRHAARPGSGHGAPHRPTVARYAGLRRCARPAAAGGRRSCVPYVTCAILLVCILQIFFLGQRHTINGSVRGAVQAHLLQLNGHMPPSGLSSGGLPSRPRFASSSS